MSGQQGFHQKNHDIRVSPPIQDLDQAREWSTCLWIESGPPHNWPHASTCGGQTAKAWHWHSDSRFARRHPHGKETSGYTTMNTDLKRRTHDRSLKIIKRNLFLSQPHSLQRARWCHPSLQQKKQGRCSPHISHVPAWNLKRSRRNAHGKRHTQTGEMFAGLAQ